MSAVAAIEALRSRGHETVVVGIAKDGRWFHVEDVLAPLRAEGDLARFVVPDGVIEADGVVHRFDVVFPVLHGPYGEDGTIQGMLEMADVPYVGSSVLGSSVAMDKDVAKRLVAEAGIPVGPWFAVRRRQFDDEPAAVVESIGARLGYPVFVKPAALGSSVGISRADDEGSAKDALIEAFRHGDKAVVEGAVAGREIEVAVLDGPRSSVPGEIVVEAGWYTYDAKYAESQTKLLVPAPLSEAQASLVRTYAERAFEVLECAGLARVDFFYEEGGRGFLLNEVNTMPGFTPKSMFPMMWEASGVSYAELCDQLVEAALS